jgi:transposase
LRSILDYTQDYPFGTDSYCPDDNRIERTWEDLHANVTRNHKCRDMSQLMRNVRAWLRRRNRKLAKKQKPSAA